MSTNLEIESKVTIDKEAYDKIEALFSSLPTYRQVNYYVCSKELLTKIDTYGMRIREKNGHFELTLKVKKDVGKLEINQEITRKTLLKLKYFKIFPNGEIKDFLISNGVCNVNKLRIIGSMTTYRKDIQFLSSLISVDKSVYNGHIDYEIECEAQNIDVSINSLKEFLSQNEIEYKKSEHSKLARFLRTLN